MKIARGMIALAVTALTAALGAAEAHAQPAAPIAARNVVLVHGAWADGSSWAAVIPLLQAAGLKVTAVQNPLTSLQDSVAATRRALALQDGPTVLVAHSWGGTVISERLRYYSRPCTAGISWLGLIGGAAGLASPTVPACFGASAGFTADCWSG